MQQKNNITQEITLPDTKQLYMFCYLKRMYKRIRFRYAYNLIKSITNIQMSRQELFNSNWQKMLDENYTIENFDKYYKYFMFTRQEIKILLKITDSKFDSLVSKGILKPCDIYSTVNKRKNYYYKIKN